MTNSENISVVTLLENDKNPYFRLLHDALEKQGVSVIHSRRPYIFPLTRAIVAHKESDVLQLDWIFDFYFSDNFTGCKIIDTFVTFGRAFLLLFDLILVSFSSTAIVWTVHNKQHHEGKYPRISRVVNEFVFWIADTVTVKCENAKGELATLYAKANSESMHVVPDGNYISAYENSISTNEARSELGIDGDTFVYLFFGMIREYKGIPELIDAFDNLHHSDSELWIVGNPKTDELRQKIERQVVTTGNVYTVFKFIEEDKIQYYMNAADILVLPYRDILNSGSVHLGMSFRLPIIAPELGCIPATVPNANEFLYDPSDPEALRRVLAEALAHPDLNSIGEANYNRAVSQNWAKAADELKGVYKRVN